MDTPRHFLAIEGMGRGAISQLLNAARAHKQAMGAGLRGSSLSGRTVANVFFEDSTRTRSSFEIAAKSLGAEVINWTTRGASVSKGETLIDTLKNLDAMGISALVIRHPSSGAALLASRHVRCAVVNAGDGTHEHPSQALLDAFTLLERMGFPPGLEGKQILIVGDILHSRVARSNIHCLAALGAKVIVCGPPTLLPSGIETLGCEVSSALDVVLPEVDAVMMLRLQLERQGGSYFPSAAEYGRLFGLNTARAARLKPGAWVMHPGPINRGVELAPEVADGERNVILDQVANGVAVRRALLEACL
ncbi:MAG TPA: aspartate carbamoyltransferase catalytic subunit [Myxococcaceae bacterium]|nr:aspartate carbamoyltransferase catalytic subunit [Myxococcaceae bacterium]